MLMIFYFLLILRIGCCIDDLNFEVIDSGHDVNLTCRRQKSEVGNSLFWMRLVSGRLPEILGATYAFDYDGVTKTLHFTAKQEPEKFILHIHETQVNDTGFYCCVKVYRLKVTLVNATFLRIKGPEPDTTAVIHVPPSDRAHSVTMRCSVLSDSEHTSCRGARHVCWFEAGSQKSHPGVIYDYRDGDDECDSSPESRAPQKCVYRFSKTISSSDAGTFSCAVVTGGELLFGNFTEPDCRELDRWDLNKSDIFLCLLALALTTSVIFNVYLIYRTKCRVCSGCKAAFFMDTNGTSDNGDQQSQRINENSLVYAAPAFSNSHRDNAPKMNRRNVKEKETVYSDIRVRVTE